MKRSISLCLSVLAFVGVPLWAYFAANANVTAQREAHGFVCGMPLLAIYLLAIFAAGLLSIGAIAFAILAYRALPSPRPKFRLLELVIMTLPIFLAVGAALALWITGG